MTIVHHPSEALLMDFAAGSLGQARSLVIAAHIHACPHCQDMVEAAEAAGGALLEDLPPSEMGPDALELAMARIERPAPGPIETPALAPAQPADWIRVPVEVREAVRHKRWVAPGVWVAPIRQGHGEPLSYLLRVGPGMRMPLHTHEGTELTLILKGAFQDGDAVFGPGDVAEADDHTEHSPHILPGGECVCLVACDNRLVVRDWLGRIVQTYAGI